MNLGEKNVYIGCIPPKCDCGGNPTTAEPGTIPPVKFDGGTSTLANFDGASSSARKFKHSEGDTNQYNFISQISQYHSTKT